MILNLNTFFCIKNSHVGYSFLCILALEDFCFHLNYGFSVTIGLQGA